MTCRSWSARAMVGLHMSQGISLMAGDVVQAASKRQSAYEPR